MFDELLKLSSKLSDDFKNKKLYLADEYDIAVVGAGHAGIEAAMAAAKLGLNCILFSMSLDAVANLPCNPNIGGTAKGQLAREVDALGGVMAEIADEATIQFRMLNASRGPAVHSPRAQVDRDIYKHKMKSLIEKQEGLLLRQAEICNIYYSDEDKSVIGVSSRTQAFYPCKAVVVAGGTYLKSRVIIGEVAYPSGPDNLFPASELSASIEESGHKLRRYKTGTPVRVKAKSIDFSKLEIQDGDKGEHFLSYKHEYGIDRPERLPQLPCYVTYTNEDTERIIRENLDRSPLFSGMIKATGTRYCPSIEDKIVKFPDKERHQIFVEPIGLDCGEIYLSGLSSSMPEEVQIQFLKTLPGFENAEIHRIGYAIEYDCIDAQELELTLESKFAQGLFFAGQVNGTSGYEEAAAQGLIAGINAARKVQGKEQLILGRADAYIGVMIDDLVTKGSQEPYRMMTARAEYRLALRQDNADERLTEIAHEFGLIDDERYLAFKYKMDKINEEIQRLSREKVKPSDTINKFLQDRSSAPLKEVSHLSELMRRPNIDYRSLKDFDSSREVLPDYIIDGVDIRLKYEGYIGLELERIERYKKLENKLLPADFDYLNMDGLRLEARQILDRVRPLNIGQAGRITGVTPADISVLLIKLEIYNRSRKNED